MLSCTRPDIIIMMLSCVVIVARGASAESPFVLTASHPSEIVQYEPLFTAIRLESESQQSLQIDRNYRATLRLERRDSPDGDWEIIWRPEVERRLLGGRVTKPGSFVPGNTIPARSSITWSQWVHWRPPLDFRGRPFVFHEVGEGELRFSLTVTALVRDNGVPKLPTFDISSKPIAIKVSRPSDEDKTALKLVTHSKFISRNEYSQYGTSELSQVSEIAESLSNDSSLKDFYCHIAGCYHLSRISEKDEKEPSYGNLPTARLASKFFSRISDRNHLLRETGAMRLLRTHEVKPHVRRAIDLSFVRENLHAAEFLPDAFFMIGINPRQHYARYLHNQELLNHIDERLDTMHVFPHQEPGERFEDYIARIAALTKVPLDLSDYPEELRSKKYPGNPQSSWTGTLREFLAPPNKRSDWYWVVSGDGYAFEYREPKF